MFCFPKTEQKYKFLYLSGRGPFVTDNELHGGSFTGSVRSEKSEQFVWTKSKRDASQRVLRSERPTGRWTIRTQTCFTAAFAARIAFVALTKRYWRRVHCQCLYELWENTREITLHRIIPVDNVSSAYLILNFIFFTGHIRIAHKQILSGVCSGYIAESNGLNRRRVSSSATKWQKSAKYCWSICEEKPVVQSCEDRHKGDNVHKCLNSKRNFIIRSHMHDIILKYSMWPCKTNKNETQCLPQ